MIDTLFFESSKIGFCCFSSSKFNKNGRPGIDYCETAQHTVINFLQMRKQVIAELNSNIPLTIAKPCKKCQMLVKRNYLFGINPISVINISCYPSICQIKCIYCSVPQSSSNTVKNARESVYPQIIIQMLAYLRENLYIHDNCFFLFAPAEISIMPHKELLLNAASQSRAQFTTNSFVFDKMIAKSMRDNGSYINTSIDAGTRETFHLVKGFDFYDKVTANIRMYRDNGRVDLKYVIIPGVNDTEDDIKGIVKLMNMLDIEILVLSYDYGTPFRSVFWSISQFVNGLREGGKDFIFYHYWETAQINDFICQCITGKDVTQYIKNSKHLSRIYTQKFKTSTNAYWFFNAYRDYIYKTELVNLFKHFPPNSLLGLVNCANDRKITAVMDELNLKMLPINTYTLLSKAYARFGTECDFIITNDRTVSQLGKRHVDIDNYMFSPKLAEEYLQNIK